MLHFKSRSEKQCHQNIHKYLRSSPANYLPRERPLIKITSVFHQSKFVPTNFQFCNVGQRECWETRQLSSQILLTFNLGQKTRNSQEEVFIINEFSDLNSLVPFISAKNYNPRTIQRRYVKGIECLRKNKHN